MPAAAADDGVSETGIEIPPALRRLQRDLDRTDEGRALISIWLQHSRELNHLVHHEPRVAATWRRADGPGLFRLVINLVDVPDRPVPREIRGCRPSTCSMSFCARSSVTPVRSYGRICGGIARFSPTCRVDPMTIS